MGAYKDKNGTWYAQFRFTNWKGEPDRKIKRGFSTKKEALEWEREFLTQSAGNLEMTFEAFYELYKKNLQDRFKKNTWNMKTSVIESKILPYFKKKRFHSFIRTQITNLVFNGDLRRRDCPVLRCVPVGIPILQARNGQSRGFDRQPYR